MTCTNPHDPARSRIVSGDWRADHGAELLQGYAHVSRRFDRASRQHRRPRRDCAGRRARRFAGCCRVCRFALGGAGYAPTLALRAAVGFGGLDPANGWNGQALIDWTLHAAEFFALVSEQSIIGRLPGLRRVPLNVRAVTAMAGATASWLGEGAPTPVSGESFTGAALKPLKVAALVVISEVLAQSSDPAAEPLIRTDLVRAMAEAIDRALLDPANASVANVMPASITFGIAPTPATASPAADVAALIGAFQGDLSRAVFVGSPARLAGLASADLRDVGLRGGEVRGAPAVASLQAGNMLALIDPGAIALGVDTLRLDTSTQGDVAWSTTPTAGPVALVSLWQNNLIAIRALQGCNWSRLRDGAVRYIVYA